MQAWILAPDIGQYPAKIRPTKAALQRTQLPGMKLKKYM